MADNIQREPVVLIDKRKKQEAHIIAASHYSFEDLMQSARRINVGVFEGEWDLTYLNPETKKPEPIDPQAEVGDYLSRDINTFYWNYKSPVFRVPSSGDTHTRFDQRNERRAHRTANRGTTYDQPSGLRSMQYASVARRFIALVIDIIIITAISGILHMRSAGFWVWWMYFAFFEASKYQATPGKMAMGLTVTDLNGNRLTFGRAMGRAFGHALSWITFTVGFFIAFFTEKTQSPPRFARRNVGVGRQSAHAARSHDGFGAAHPRNQCDVSSCAATQSNKKPST